MTNINKDGNVFYLGFSSVIHWSSGCNTAVATQAGRRPGYWSNLLVPEVTCPVIGRARPGVAPGRRRRTGPGAIGCPACATETGQHRRGSVAMTVCRPQDRRTTTGLVYPYRCSVGGRARNRRRVWIAQLWLITRQAMAGMTWPNYICMMLLKKHS